MNFSNVTSCSLVLNVHFYGIKKHTDPEGGESFFPCKTIRRFITTTKACSPLHENKIYNAKLSPPFVVAVHFGNFILRFTSREKYGHLPLWESPQIRWKFWELSPVGHNREPVNIKGNTVMRLARHLIMRSLLIIMHNCKYHEPSVYLLYRLCDPYYCPSIVYYVQLWSY